MLSYPRQIWFSLVERFPLLQRLSALGLKYVLVETLIEIPFLLIELSIWFGPLFGIGVGLTLWQRVALAAALYALVEGGRFLVVAMIRKQPYRFLSAEWEVLKALIAWLVRLVQRLGASLGARRISRGQSLDQGG